MWKVDANHYAEEMASPYHHERCRDLATLLPDDASGQAIIDFGCGDGHFTRLLAKRGAAVTGIERDETLLKIARNRGARAYAGDVESLKHIGTSSIDGIVCFNVIAYMTRREEEEFYAQASRMLRHKGWMATSHSNLLFDLFSANSLTRQFFEKELESELPDDVILPEAMCATETYLRANPLSYCDAIRRFGFVEVRQCFSHWHSRPPRGGAIDTDGPPHSDWRRMFQCSIYGSLAMRVIYRVGA